MRLFSSGCPQLSVLLEPTAVLLQQPRVREALTAEAAEERPFSSVHLHVKLHVCELTESHMTHLTLIWLVPQVDEQMFGVIGADTKGLSTVLTLVRLLPCVLQSMTLQRLLVNERLFTQFALKRSLP